MAGEKETAASRDQKRGLWTVEEDKILVDYVMSHGKGKWNSVARRTGLKRCGKSCRLRWMNYLSPNVKRDSFSEEEDDLIIRLHNLLGNRWSLIAKRVPGRTDNQVKNHWNTHLSKRFGINKQAARPRKSKTKASSSNSADPCSTSSSETIFGETPEKKCNQDNKVNQVTKVNTTELAINGSPTMDAFWDFASEFSELGAMEFPNGNSGDVSWLHS